MLRARLPSPLVDRTFVICKPDAVERGLTGEILGRFERKGLRVVSCELRSIDRATAEQHYAEHAGKPFFADLIGFITRGPALLIVLEGPSDTWEVVRAMTGATNSRKAAPGTIRGDLGVVDMENLVHASDGLDSAAREIALFFPGMA